MKKTIQTLFLTFSMALLVTSCKKEKDESPIVGSWQITKIETRITGQNWQNLGQPCRHDDVEEYQSNGKWTYYDGANQCEPGSGILRGTWKLAANDTKVVFTYEGASGEYDKNVESLTESSMVLLHNAGDLNNTQYRYTFTKK